jgi:hypothetical protein
MTCSFACNCFVLYPRDISTKFTIVCQVVNFFHWMSANCPTNVGQYIGTYINHNFSDLMSAPQLRQVA